MNLTNLSIKECYEGLKSKKFTSVDLVKAYLENIEKFDKKINAFLFVDEEGALAQAKKVDKLISAGKKISLLAGVPCAIKDNILVEGQKCTAGSKILENYIAPYDATVIKKLKNEDAVILGKTNLDEFAMGSSTENSAFKITKNPADLERVPGGSSGGSAAAVAANMACYALGSDTGGSIRQPASFCGVVGLKPTYGAVSRYGLIAFASSLDQIGPLTKNVEDAKIVFGAIAGKDPLDATSIKSNFQFSTSNFQIKNLRIGIPKEYFVEGINKEVESGVKETIKKIEKQGAKIKEISLSSTKYALAAYYIVAPSEASANLARYDGIKYGYSEIRNLQQENQNLLDVYLKSRGKGFGPEVKRRIMLGTYSLSSGYYDAYYKKAQEVVATIKKEFKKTFEEVDLIFTPVSATPPFKIGEKIKDPLSMYLSDIFTVAVNLAGLPAISVPCAKTKEGLSIGLQIIGNSLQENKILETAVLVEQLVN